MKTANIPARLFQPDYFLQSTKSRKRHDVIGTKGSQWRTEPRSGGLIPDGPGMCEYPATDEHSMAHGSMRQDAVAQHLNRDTQPDISCSPTSGIISSQEGRYTSNGFPAVIAVDRAREYPSKSQLLSCRPDRHARYVDATGQRGLISDSIPEPQGRKPIGVQIPSSASGPNMVNVVKWSLAKTSKQTGKVVSKQASEVDSAIYNTLERGNIVQPVLGSPSVSDTLRSARLIQMAAGLSWAKPANGQGSLNADGSYGVVVDSDPDLSARLSDSSTSHGTGNNALIGDSEGANHSTLAVDDVASPSPQSGIAGELWLDTLSFQDWLQTHLTAELRRSVCAPNRLAGIDI